MHVRHQQRGIRNAALRACCYLLLGASGCSHLGSALVASSRSLAPLPLGRGSRRTALAAAKAPFQGCRLVEVSGDDGSLWHILNGKTAEDNDRLSLEEGRSGEPWMHAAGVPGSHVVVRRAPSQDGQREAPDEVIEKAAGIAAFYSKASGSTVKIHLTKCGKVGKAKGAPAGQVLLKGDFTTLTARKLDPAKLVQKAKAEPSARAAKAQDPSAPAKPQEQRPEFKSKWKLKQSQDKLNGLEQALKDLEAEIATVGAKMLAAGSTSGEVAKLFALQQQLQQQQDAAQKKWEEISAKLG